MVDSCALTTSGRSCKYGTVLVILVTVFGSKTKSGRTKTKTKINYKSKTTLTNDVPVTEELVGYAGATSVRSGGGNRTISVSDFHPLLTVSAASAASVCHYLLSIIGRCALQGCVPVTTMSHVSSDMASVETVTLMKRCYTTELYFK